MHKLIYLASPYSKYPGGRKEAFDYVCLKAGELMLAGNKVFCPIAHSHSIEQYMPGVQSGSFWLDQDFAVLEACDELWVYCMPGWKESDGVRREIAYAWQRNIPVKYVEHDAESINRTAA